MNDKIKDFGQKVETVVTILGSYIEHNIKDREKFDHQLKTIFETGEKVFKRTLVTAMNSDFVKDNIGVAQEYANSRAKNGSSGSESQSAGTPAYQDLTLKVKTLDHFTGDLPKYETPLAAGFDVRAQIEKPLTLKPGERKLVPTGLSFEIPEGFEIQARPRSGLAIKKGIGLVNSPGTIDADYRGEIKIIIINHGAEDVTFEPQERIAQLVMAPVYQAKFVATQDLSETERGEGGFGSTGLN